MAMMEKPVRLSKIGLWSCSLDSGLLKKEIKYYKHENNKVFIDMGRYSGCF